MKSKLQQVIKGQGGQAGLLVIVGLILFLLGVIFLLVWGRNMEHNGGWFFPGLLLAAAGFVLLYFGGRSSS
jgi:hypothetical protein